jgi:hypothetical protein
MSEPTISYLQPKHRRSTADESARPHAQISETEFACLFDASLIDT